jgi:hypothetical protein
MGSRVAKRWGYEEIVETTRAHFATEPEFGPIDEFYKRRAEHVAQR